MKDTKVDMASARMMHGRGVEVEEVARTLDRPVAWVKRALGETGPRKPSKQKYERRGYTL